MAQRIASCRWDLCDAWDLCDMPVASVLLVSCRLIAMRILLFVSVCCIAPPASAELISFGGQTMGTTYSVKIFDPPAGEASWQLDVDAELRAVNDQMSTYLKTSEISRFNASESTDWFEVSKQTAMVCQTALEIGRASGGALDVTLGGLVDRWNFGTARRDQTVPTEGEVKRLQASTGLDKFHVRLDPPAIRKDIPGLKVDLSAIAKGHGVDRVVELLEKRGATNVFVEIGGEVRVAGDKGGEPWRVGIQRPDVAGLDAMIAHPIRDAAMATSGDYRNYFDADRKRYSHTLDPSTGRPVVDPVASVSVVADSCMIADGWATALTAMGPGKIDLAVQSNQLDAFWMVRSAGGLVGRGTGRLAEYAFSPTPVVTVSEVTEAQASFLTQMLPLAAVTAAVLLLVIGGMAVGAMAGRQSIGGSCGGLNARTDPDGVDRCNVCSTPSTACKELREKVSG